MKKAIMFILRYVSVTAGFFAAGAIVVLIIALSGNGRFVIPYNILWQWLAVSVLYAASSPISFSVKHFIKYSMTARLLIQTAVNYPILILSALGFGWIDSMNGFYMMTTVYFFMGMAATLVICIYYPRKYKRYNESLSAYKKKST